jgi:hypothetical protein
MPRAAAWEQGGEPPPTAARRPRTACDPRATGVAAGSSTRTAARRTLSHVTRPGSGVGPIAIRTAGPQIRASGGTDPVHRRERAPMGAVARGGRGLPRTSEPQALERLRILLPFLRTLTRRSRYTSCSSSSCPRVPSSRSFEVCPPLPIPIPFCGRADHEGRVDPRESPFLHLLVPAIECWSLAGHCEGLLADSPRAAPRATGR